MPPSPAQAVAWVMRAWLEIQASIRLRPSCRRCRFIGDKVAGPTQLKEWRVACDTFVAFDDPNSTVCRDGACVMSRLARIVPERPRGTTEALLHGANDAIIHGALLSKSSEGVYARDTSRFAGTRGRQRRDFVYSMDGQPLLVGEETAFDSQMPHAVHDLCVKIDRTEFAPSQGIIGVPITGNQMQLLWIDTRSKTSATIQAIDLSTIRGRAEAFVRVLHLAPLLNELATRKRPVFQRCGSDSDFHSRSIAAPQATQHCQSARSGPRMEGDKL